MIGISSNLPCIFIDFHCTIWEDEIKEERGTHMALHSGLIVPQGGRMDLVGSDEFVLNRVPRGGTA